MTFSKRDNQSVSKLIFGCRQSDSRIQALNHSTDGPILNQRQLGDLAGFAQADIHLHTEETLNMCPGVHISNSPIDFHRDLLKASSFTVSWAASINKEAGNLQKHQTAWAPATLAPYSRTTWGFSELKNQVPNCISTQGNAN